MCWTKLQNKIAKMIEPIKDILTNWRNPQHGNPKESSYYFIASFPVELRSINEGEITAVYKNNIGVEISQTILPAAPIERVVNFAGNATFTKVVVPRSSKTTFLSLKGPDNVVHVLIDRR